MPYTDDDFGPPLSRPAQKSKYTDDDFLAPLSRPMPKMEATQLQKPAAFKPGPQGDTLDPRDPKTRTSLFQDLGTSPLTREAMRASGAGVEQMKQPGVFNKAMGALGIATAPFKQAEAYLSDPIQVITKKLGGSPETQQDVRAWTDALVDVAPAVLTGGASVAMKAAAKSLATREAAAMTPGALDAAAKTAFADASKLGVKLKPGVYGKFLDSVQPTLDHLGAQSEALAFSPEAYPYSDKILRLFARPAQDARLTLDDVKAMQTQINEFVRQAMKANEGGKPGTDLKLAQTLSSQFRNFTDDVMATGPLNKARDLWSRKLKADDVKWLIDRAKTLRDHDFLPQQMRNIALNPMEMKRFTPQEQKLIEKIAAGSVGEDVTSAAASGRHGAVGRGIKMAKALRPVDTKDAEELVKLIAKGKGAQMVDDLPAQPGLADRVKGLLGGR